MQESPYLEDNRLLLERMQHLPFFGSIGPEHVRNILHLSKIRRFDDGEVITREGSFDSWVYVLFSGAVRVARKEEELARLDDVGSIFGELAVIDGKARSASVEAVGPTVCLAIDVSFMNETTEPLDLARFVTVLYKFFAEVIAQRLRSTNEELAKAHVEIERLKAGRR
jgi:CRP-like cAMP-binding protein